jgi:hypothetical protein
MVPRLLIGFGHMVPIYDLRDPGATSYLYLQVAIQSD